jgi:group I intron endonuclease
VGKTKRSLDQRWKEHVRNAVKGRAEMPLYAAIRKHGPEAFEHRTLQECPSESELDAAERRWIAELGTFRKGYNATEGGDGVKGLRHTEETKRRMGEARKGEKNVNWGGLSEEHKRNISLGRKGKGVGPRPDACGWHHDEEARAKIGSAQFKQVEQISPLGEVVAIYPSVIAAETATGVGRTGISRSCRLPHRQAGGFKWRYLETKGNQ